MASRREWLVTNRIGGYGCGTIAEAPTRHYNGLLVATLKPRLTRTLLVTKMDETAVYLGQTYELLHSDLWGGGVVHPQGFLHL